MLLYRQHDNNKHVNKYIQEWGKNTFIFHIQKYLIGIMMIVITIIIIINISLFAIWVKFHVSERILGRLLTDYNMQY